MLPNQPVQGTEPTEQKIVQPLEAQTVPPTPASEEEPFDKDRAMKTIEKLRGIEKQYKQEQKEYERLKAEEQKRLDAQLSEAERLKKQLDEVSAAKSKLESDLMRRDVVTEMGLPPAFADRLKGVTKEELLADAQELLKVLPQQPKKPSQTPTNPGSAALEETDAQMRERLFGKQKDIFNMQTIKEMGGGVVIHTKE